MHGNDTFQARFADPRIPHEVRRAWAMAGRGNHGCDDMHEGRGPVPNDDDGGGRGSRGRGREGRRGESRSGGFGPGGFGPGGFGPGGFGRGGFGPGGFGPGGFGPGGPHRRGGGRRPGRGGRGDVRAAVLLLLTEGPMHGYQLIQQITERSGGVWTPSPGSVYPALSQLEDEGLVLLERVDGRNTASLTPTGTAYVEEHREELGSPWDDASDAVSSEMRDLREDLGALMGAARQISQVGTPAQVAEASRQLTQARKALYRILADDESPA